MNLGQPQEIAIRDAFADSDCPMLGCGARGKRIGIFPTKDYDAIFLDHEERGPISSSLFETDSRNCVPIVLNFIDPFHCAPSRGANPIMAITSASP